MWVAKLILRNAGRHKLRTLLTIIGLAVTVVAFGVIRTLIDSYYKSADVIPPDRLIARNSVSITMNLPLSYMNKIESVPGVEAVSYGNWFGGLYNNDYNNFFPNYAVGPKYMDLYSEYLLPADQRAEYEREKNSAVAGQRLANRFGWKIGDPISLTGQIFPGQWDFILRGIYTAKEPGVDESSLIFRWDYFDERLRQTTPEMAGGVGWYVIKIDNPDNAATISANIDALFRNSTFETMTETEKAFTLNFMAMMESIMTGMKIISFLIIGVILLVLANTMAMSARERISEYALLKTLGFKSFHLIGLILGESLAIAFCGGLLGVILLYPVVDGATVFIQSFFSSIQIETITVIIAMIFVLAIGLVSAVFPIFRATKLSIIDGLRNVG